MFTKILSIVTIIVVAFVAGLIGFRIWKRSQKVEVAPKPKEEEWVLINDKDPDGMTIFKKGSEFMIRTKKGAERIVEGMTALIAEKNLLKGQ